MAAEDIRARTELWVLNEIKKQGLGEDYGWAVTWGPMAGQGPQGPVMVPAWVLVLTCQNPLLGQGDLYHIAQLGAPRPKEADVRREVAEGIRQLRVLAKSKVSGANGGHAAAAVPG